MDDVALPRATVDKIIKEYLPKDVRLGPSTLDLLLQCCGEFIQLVSSEANSLSEEEKKSTIIPDHIIRALERLGFSAYLDDMNSFWKEVKDTEQQQKSLQRHASNAAEKNAMSEEEQIALQKKLFAEARARTLSCALPDAAGAHVDQKHRAEATQRAES